MLTENVRFTRRLLFPSTLRVPTSPETTTRRAGAACAAQGPAVGWGRLHGHPVRSRDKWAFRAIGPGRSLPNQASVEGGDAGSVRSACRAGRGWRAGWRAGWRTGWRAGWRAGWARVIGWRRIDKAALTRLLLLGAD